MIAARYARTPVADELSYQKKLEVTRTYLRPDMEVLEIGCGTGSTAIVHAPFVKHVRAVDFSSNMIGIARSKAEAAGIGNISFEVATVDDLAVPDGSLDMVLALSLLHLLDDWEVVIARIYRMLKPGGIFVTSTTCLGDFFKVFKYIAPVGKALGLMPVVKVFTVRQLTGAMTAAGFRIDYQWQPSRKKAVFIVAKKPEHS